MIQTFELKNSNIQIFALQKNFEFEYECPSLTLKLTIRIRYRAFRNLIHACVYAEFLKSTALTTSNYYDNMEIITYLEFEHTRKT